MWQTDITIDKNCRGNEYLSRALAGGKYIMSSAETRGRYLYSIACEDDADRAGIAEIVMNCILVNMKFDYLKDKTGITESDEYVTTLLSAMLYFDRKYENGYIASILNGQYEYSVDGIFNFKLQHLTDNWTYMAELYDNIKSNIDDVASLTSYLLESGKVEGRDVYAAYSGENYIVTDVKSGRISELYDLYESREYNALAAALAMHPDTIYADNRSPLAELLPKLNYAVKFKLI